MILISACLLGVPTRYDGAALPLLSFPAELAGRALLPVCPEELGGLGTPRPPAEIDAGADGGAVLDGRARVRRPDGTDVTAAFLSGAEALVRLARERGAAAAWLKSKSPSCGAGRTHAGGRAVAGFGVAAEALRRAGLEVFELG